MHILEDILAQKTPREPLGVAIADALANSKINYKLLGRMIDYQLFDIERGDMNSMTELEVYAENTRSLLLYLNLHLLRIDDSEALTTASHLGRCIGICDVIKKLPYYLALHRGYLPRDVLYKVSLVSNIFTILLFASEQHLFRKNVG